MAHVARAAVICNSGEDTNGPWFFARGRFIFRGLPYEKCCSCPSELRDEAILELGCNGGLDAGRKEPLEDADALAGCTGAR